MHARWDQLHVALKVAVVRLVDAEHYQVAEEKRHARGCRKLLTCHGVTIEEGQEIVKSDAQAAQSLEKLQVEWVEVLHEKATSEDCD